MKWMIRVAALGLLAGMGVAGCGDPSGPPVVEPPEPPTVEPPVIEFVWGPAEGSVIARYETAVAVTVTTDSLITSLVFWVNDQAGGNLLGPGHAANEPSYPMTVTGLQPGENVVRVRATAGGATSEAELRFRVEVAPARYSVTPVGTLAGGESIARDLNEQGHVVGDALASHGYWHAFFWAGGPIVDVHPPELAQSEAVAVNASGQVVVNATSGSQAGCHSSFVWQTGSHVPIHDCGAGVDINGAGQVPVNLTPTGPGQALAMWQAGTLTWDAMGGGQPFYTIAAVNDLGHVAGTTILHGSLASLWNGTTLLELHPSVGLDLNDSGAVLGWTSGHGQAYAYVWKAGAVTKLHGFAGLSPTAINNHGVVVGMAGPGGTQVGFLWEDGTTREIVLEEAGWRLVGVAEINDAGQIAATAVRTATGKREAVLLTRLP